MKTRTMIILASAMLAGSLLASDAQARGGGGGHMGAGGGHMGGFGGGHMGGLGGHMGGFGGHTGGFEGSHLRHFGRAGYGAGLYDDGLGCSSFDHSQMYHGWRPSCS